MKESLPVLASSQLPTEPGYPGVAGGEGLPPQNSGFKLSKYLAFLKKFWWIPLITLILAGGGVFAYLRWLPPTYISRAAMWETVKLRLSGEGALFSEDVQNYLGTQIELLRSGKMAQLAIARVQATSTNPIPTSKEGGLIPVRINVYPSPKSTVLVIEASSSDAAYTQAFLNALLEEFLIYKKNLRKSVSGDTLASISEQVMKLERDLKSDQDALTTFQRSNNLAILQEEGNLAGGYLTKLKMQLSDLRLEDQLLGAPSNTNSNTPAGVVDATTVAASASGNSSAASPDRQTASRELELLKMERAKLAKKLKSKHPRIVKLDADIARAEKIVEMYRNQSQEQLAAARQAIKLKTDAVITAIKEWEAKVVEANARIAEAERLKANVVRAQSVYDRLTSMLQNVDISRNIDQETLAVLEPASPAYRSYQKEGSSIRTAIFGGLAAGLGIIFLIAKLDDQVTSATELTEKVGSTVVAQVPEVGKIKGENPLPLLLPDDQRHMYAESYRNLRSALLFLPGDNRSKVILITSAVPNEGKSTVAVNLARTLAMGGSRVLLMDGDMRKGHLHETMSLQREPGFAELLRDPAQLEMLIQTDAVPNLFFISRGGHINNPGDLFLGSRMNEILDRARQQFDYVLIDSSPVFAADDATTLAPRVDGTLFVVRNRYSHTKAARQALDLLTQRQARILGVIFNRADTSGKSHYYYKYGDYYGSAKTA